MGCFSQPCRPSLLAPGLAGYQLDAAQASLRVNLHKYAVQNSFAVFAAGVGDGDAIQLLDALGLVDMAVQADQRTILGYRVAGRRAAHRDHLRPRPGHDHPQVLIEPRCQVESGAERRHVQAEDGLAGVLDAGGDLIYPRGEFVLGNVARAGPWGGVAVAHAEDLVSVPEIDDAPVGILDYLRLAECVIDLEEVVVGAADHAPDAGAPELLVGLGQPLLDPLDHQLMEELVDPALVFGVPGLLIRGHLARVLAGVRDADLELGHLLGRLDPARDAKELGRRVPAGLPDDRDHELPGDVPADHDDVGVVVLGGGQELLPA